MPARNLLERAGESIKIKPRSMEVLVYLAEHAGEVVSTDALLGAVWQGRIVSDGTVYQYITRLRQALGDSAAEARIIETIPKRGYRLVAPVEILEATADLRKDTAGRMSRIGFAAAGLLVLLLGLGYMLQPSEQSHDAGRQLLPDSVAVLPLTNLSPDPEHAYFAAGIHESIINQLGGLRNLNVIARSSVMQYEGVRISEIAKDLRVEAVLEGSVRYAGDRVLINVELIDGTTETQVWNDEYEGDLSDIFAFQADIATNIANALEIEFSPAQQKGIERAPTYSPEAYSLYLRALVLPPSYAERIQYLDRAIELDPEFGLALADKALRFALRGREVSEQWEKIAREAAERALALDTELALAHVALAFLHQSNSRALDAERAFQRAMELAPNDTLLLASYGRFRRYRGEYMEAIHVGSRAVELDPNNAVNHYHLGITYRQARRYDEAASAFRTALVSNPTFFPLHLQLGYTEISRGNRAEALGHLQVGEELMPDSAPASRLAQFALAYSQLDRREDVERLLDTVREKAKDSPISDAVWAIAYMALGDYERALERLNAAVNDPARDIIRLAGIKANINSDPELDRPEFQEVLSRLWNDSE